MSNLTDIQELIAAIDLTLDNESLSPKFKDGVRHAKNLILIWKMEECIESGIDITLCV